MRSATKFFAIGVLVAAPVLAFAHGSDGPSTGHGPGMMMNQEQMDQMHRNWSRMDNMMQQVPGAGSPAERQRLMEEHWEAMEEQMELMHQGMMGPGMMGPGMMGGNQGQGMMNNQSGDRSANADKGSVDQRMRLMEERMDQMQLMMEQMFRHQQQQNRN